VNEISFLFSLLKMNRLIDDTATGRPSVGKGKVFRTIIHAALVRWNVPAFTFACVELTDFGAQAAIGALGYIVVTVIPHSRTLDPGNQANAGPTSALSIVSRAGSRIGDMISRTPDQSGEIFDVAGIDRRFRVGTAWQSQSDKRLHSKNEPQDRSFHCMPPF